MPFAPNHAASVAFALTPQESLARAAPLILRALPLVQLALLLLQTSLCLLDLRQALSVALSRARWQLTPEEERVQCRHARIHLLLACDDTVGLRGHVAINAVDDALLRTGGHLCKEGVPLLSQGVDLLLRQVPWVLAPSLARSELQPDVCQVTAELARLTWHDRKRR